VCARDRPTGSRPLYESSRAPKYQSVSFLPCPRQNEEQRGLVFPANAQAAFFWFLNRTISLPYWGSSHKGIFR
jgi:hypothetical protein